jgi:hypothetical protein
LIAMRVVVSVLQPVDDERQVNLRVESQAGEVIASRVMAARPWAVPAIAAVLDRLEDRRRQAGDVRVLGGQLFDCLLGSDGWQAVTAEASRRNDRIVELALAWDAGEHELNRLPWEAMHDGGRFIAAHDRLYVAVTRIVTDASVECRPPVPAPARVLVAIGCDLSDRHIRSGAEVLGLLRDAERGAGAIDAHIVDQASLERISDACGSFEPHIVHIVSHGHLRADGSGVIELQEDDAHDGMASGPDLLGAFAPSLELPQLVVLTGCDTAAAGEHLDSLAAELVKGGIPKAIGMAGKITDPVCRLFTRRFGTALNEGKALVEAMSHGRRAGLRRQSSAPEDDPSWALPSIYLAPTVPADHSPVDDTQRSALLERVEHYDLRQDPVFCGRRPFMRLFDRLIDRGDELQALVAYVDGTSPLGQTRLAHELTGRALRAGHVVVRIDDDGNEPDLPRTVHQLAIGLQRAMVNARAAFDLRPPTRSTLLEELAYASSTELDLTGVTGKQWTTRVHSFLGSCDGTIDAEALKHALAQDLPELIADARRSSDGTVGGNSQAVVILGGLGQWGEATTALLEKLLSASGLGAPEERVPVFAVGSYGDPGGAYMKTGCEFLNAKRWSHVEELTPFDDDEAVLAYQWVLLHPRAESGSLFSDAVYTPASDHENDWHEMFHSCIAGIPGRFDEDVFYAIAEALRRGKIMVADDDAGALREYADQLAAERGAA